MKKRFLALCACLCLLLAGCGASESTESTDTTTDTGSAEQVSTDTGSGTGTVSSDTETPEDGEYLAIFDTDSSMFHVNEAMDGRGTLFVRDGEMTISVALVSRRIVNLYVGTAEDAEQADESELLQPTTETVEYSDGTTEEVYAFEIPVPALDEEFNVAILGEKGTWYDHKVSVSDPQPITGSETADPNELAGSGA